jgi:hypothetical protein
MWNGFIGQQIKRNNRNILLRNLALLAVPVAIAGGAPRYWQNFFAGAQPISNESLVQLIDPEAAAQYFVQVEGSQTVDTGATEVTTPVRGGSTVGTPKTSASYVALLVDSRFLLVKANPDRGASTKFQGTLEAIPGKESERVLDQFQAAVPEMKGMFLPYMLKEQTTDMFNGGGFLALGLVHDRLGAVAAANVGPPLV